MSATLADIQAKYGDSVYPLYKDEMHAPYMENDNGVGYKGVVMYDKEKDLIQCSECGMWLKKMNIFHLKKHGFESLREYKDKFDIYYKVPIQSRELSRKQSLSAISNGNFVKKMGTVCANVKQRGTNGMKKVMFKNKHGSCDAQIEARIRVVIDTFGDNFTHKTLRKYDYGLAELIKRRFGSFNKAKTHFGLKTNKSKPMEKYSDFYLIGKLRKFIKDNGYIPKNNQDDWPKEIPYIRTYYRHFGSWRRAKMMAGLDQLLQEVK